MCCASFGYCLALCLMRLSHATFSTSCIHAVWIHCWSLISFSLLSLIRWLLLFCIYLQAFEICFYVVNIYAMLQWVPYPWLHSYFPVSFSSSFASFCTRSVLWVWMLFWHVLVIVIFLVTFLLCHFLGFVFYLAYAQSSRSGRSSLTLGHRCFGCWACI